MTRLPMPSPIKNGRVVSLAYELYNDEGELVDEAPASRPLRYVHGKGELVPGLESALDGKSTGDELTVELAAEDAFGSIDEDGIFEVERSIFPDQDEVLVGDEFVAELEEGKPISMRVLEVHDDSLVVDTNHPLAGQAVRFVLRITDVDDSAKPAPKQESSKAKVGRRPGPKRKSAGDVP